MAAFTIPLEHVIKLSGGTTRREKGILIVENCDLGLNDYEIFDESYRARLNGKILDHYFNQEIGTETIDLFIQAMRRKMNEIMPYYNQMYESTLIEFDPLRTVDLKTMAKASNIQDVSSHGESVVDATTSNKSRVVAQQLPQTMLAGNKDYATSASDSNTVGENASQSNEEASVNTSQNGENESNTVGYQGLASSLIMSLRDSFLNLDLSIIREHAENFMLLWDNSDAHYPSRMGYYF